MIFRWQKSGRSLLQNTSMVGVIFFFFFLFSSTTEVSCRSANVLKLNAEESSSRSFIPEAKRIDDVSSLVDVLPVSLSSSTSLSSMRLLGCKRERRRAKTKRRRECREEDREEIQIPDASSFILFFFFLFAKGTQRRKNKKKKKKTENRDEDTDTIVKSYRYRALNLSLIYPSIQLPIFNLSVYPATYL